MRRLDAWTRKTIEHLKVNKTDSIHKYRCMQATVLSPNFVCYQKRISNLFPVVAKHSIAYHGSRLARESYKYLQLLLKFKLDFGKVAIVTCPYLSHREWPLSTNVCISN